MSGRWHQLSGPAGLLQAYVAAIPPGSLPGKVLVLCHELPQTSGSTSVVGRTYPALADRLAEESGWRVVVSTLRGAGGSEGDFSAGGWLDDLRFLVDHEVGPERPVCMVGFGLGGAVALRMAADDDRVAGVGALGSPDDLAGWARDPAALLERCRISGVVRTRDFPDDLDAWAAELVGLDPLGAAASLGGRPLLVVHGAADLEVPVAAGRALAAAGGSRVDLRVLPGAGHWLRADPRVVATMIGWLERQR